MSFETETVLDRRRLRRRITTWRGLAIAAGVFALCALAVSGSQYGAITGQKQIARMEIVGTITEDRDQLKLLKKIEEAEHVSALLLYVNSPGGTTTGGEALYEALRRVSAKKPVVAQFGTVAASAGYIMGLGADHIVTRGNTITGSVGVIFQWPQVTEMLDKVGVKFNVVRSGEQKALPSPFEDFSERSREVTQSMIDESFRWFLSLVEERRGIRATDLPDLSSGRTFSGREAVKLKLADELGGEAEAIKWLEEKRNVPKDLDVVTWKKDDVKSFGFGAAVANLLPGVFGNSGAMVADLFSRDRHLSTLGLDGMLSVWHPSEN